VSVLTAEGTANNTANPVDGARPCSIKRIPPSRSAPKEKRREEKKKEKNKENDSSLACQEYWIPPIVCHRRKVA
jgi:hypothetical protein